MTIKTVAMTGLWVQVEVAGATYTLQNRGSPGNATQGGILIADSVSAPADETDTFVLAASHDMLQFAFTNGVWAKGPSGTRIASGV